MILLTFRFEFLLGLFFKNETNNKNKQTNIIKMWKIKHNGGYFILPHRWLKYHKILSRYFNLPIVWHNTVLSLLHDCKLYITCCTALYCFKQRAFSRHNLILSTFVYHSHKSTVIREVLLGICSLTTRRNSSNYLIRKKIIDDQKIPHKTFD